MSQSQDTQLALLLSRLEILDQARVDKALEIQASAEAEGAPTPLAAILVRQGFLPYGVVERIIAHLSDTKLACKGCQAVTGAKSLSPVDPFHCPSCKKPLPLPEEDTALTALETIVEGQPLTARDKGLLGRVLGGCKIERKIGEGGMGAVYEATQEFLNRKVAVKVLPEYHIHQPGFVERFLRESRSAAQVIHPNVVQVMDAGREEDLYYIIMEFVEGKSLQGILDDEGRLPVHKALEFARQSAMGLGAAADHDIIHRDIKPDNIRVNPRGMAKVADFGLAKDVRTSTQVTMTGAVVGTPLYMSPEQARGEAVDFRGDIYALGATLYHLIAGAPPFTGGSAITILQKHLSEEAQPLSEIVEDCPPEVDALVKKMMAKDRDHRFPTYADLVKAIEEIQGRATTMRETVIGGNVSAKGGATAKAAADVGERPAKPGRKEPAGKKSSLLPLIIVGVVAVLAVAGLVVMKGIGGDKGGGSTAGGGTTGGGSTDTGGTGTSGGGTPPVAALAALEITSEPGGALVFLDDEQLGNTPLTLEDLDAGVRKLRLELRDHESVTKDVHLIGGKTIRESLRLEKSPSFVRIVSPPEEGADVYVDGEWKGKTPLDLSLAGAGSYELRVEATGYGPVKGSITVKAGQNPEQSFSLSALPATMKVISQPSGAQIRIDGEVVGTTPVEKTDIAPGTHVVEASLEGHISKEVSLRLTPGGTTEHKFLLERPADAKRFMKLIAEAEALLRQDFAMRAYDKWATAMAPGDLPEGLTGDEQRRARKLRVDVSAAAPRMDLYIQLGQTRLRGESLLPETPKAVSEFTGAGSTFDLEVKAPLQETLRMTVLQFGLSGRWSYRLLPDEGIASREDNVPELLDEWKETYRLAQEDVLLFVLIAKKDDFSIKAIDAIKGAVAMEENDPVKRGGAVIQLLREWLEKSGDDYGLRAVWIDGRP